MGMFRFLAPAVMGMALGLSLAGGASASTVSCVQGDWRYSLGPALGPASCQSGNDSQGALNTLNFAGSNAWKFAYKIDLEKDKNNPGNILEVVTTANGAPPPSLSITGYMQTAVTPTWAIATGAFTYQKLAVVLKQANGYAAFLIDQVMAKTATGFAGTWTTEQWKKLTGGQNPTFGYVSSNDLSHASLYFVGQEAAAPIPLPVGAWLALTAVGGFVMLRRRKAAVAA